MFISKEQLEAIKFADVDPTRGAICGLYINESEVAATDGHRLMVAQHVQPDFMEDSERIEEKENKKRVTSALPPESIKLPGILSRTCIEVVLKAWPKMKKSERREWHNWAWVTHDGITVLDSYDNPITFPAQWLDGRYPNHKQVIPALEDCPRRIGLNARYLADGQYLTDTRSKMLDINMRTQNDPALIIGETPENGHACQYVVMPMRLDSNELERQEEAEAYEYSKAFQEAELELLDMPNFDPFKDTIEIHGRTYLKRDLDAALKQAEVAA